MDGAGPSRPSWGRDGRPSEGRPPDGPDPRVSRSAPRVGDHEQAIERLCYAGESVLDVVRVSGGLVGVTTHRVLALTPGDSGPNFQAIDRPNVTDVELSSGGDAGHGLRAVRYGVYALVLLGGSFLVDFSSVSAVEPPAEAGAGAGEVVGLALAMTSMLAVVDDVLRIAGAVVLLVALVFAALYGYSRDSYLAVGVAGDDPVCVPAATSESAAAARLRVAVENASKRGADASGHVEKASNPSAD